MNNANTKGWHNGNIIMLAFLWGLLSGCDEHTSVKQAQSLLSTPVFGTKPLREETLRRMQQSIDSHTGADIDNALLLADTLFNESMRGSAAIVTRRHREKGIDTLDMMIIFDFVQDDSVGAKRYVIQLQQDGSSAPLITQGNISWQCSRGGWWNTWYFAAWPCI